MPIYRASIVPRLRYGVELLGVKDGLNRVFTTPDSFVYYGVDQVTVCVYHNGRRLIQTAVATPQDGDYSVSESVPGNGYDTITFLSLIPTPGSELRADYIICC